MIFPILRIWSVKLLSIDQRRVGCTVKSGSAHMHDIFFHYLSLCKKIEGKDGIMYKSINVHISYTVRLVGELGEKVEEIDVACLHRALVDVIRADPRRPHGSLILLGQSLHERVETNLVLQSPRDRTSQHVLSGSNVFVQI